MMEATWFCPRCKKMAKDIYSQVICSECGKARNGFAEHLAAVWVKTSTGWVAEDSSLRGLAFRNCPQCGKVIGNLGTPQREPCGSEEVGEIMGWCQTHICGAQITIVND